MRGYGSAPTLSIRRKRCFPVVHRLDSRGLRRWPHIVAGKEELTRISWFWRSRKRLDWKSVGRDGTATVTLLLPPPLSSRDVAQFLQKQLNHRRMLHGSGFKFTHLKWVQSGLVVTGKPVKHLLQIVLITRFWVFSTVLLCVTMILIPSCFNQDVPVAKTEWVVITVSLRSLCKLTSNKKKGSSLF